MLGLSYNIKINSLHLSFKVKLMNTFSEFKLILVLP